MRQRLDEYADHEPSFRLVGEERAEAEPEQQEYAAPRRLIPRGIVTAAVMAVFAGGLYFAYVQGTRHTPAAGSSASSSGDAVPLIRADERPTKVKPDQPGGMDVPDRDKLVYSEKPGGPPVERLLPGPEQPAPRPLAPLPPPPVPSLSPPQALAPASPGTVEPGPAEKPGAPAQQPAMSAPKRPARPVPEPKPAPSEGKPAPAAKAGGIRVQLGSLRSPEAAREEWARLKSANADVLGNLTAVAVRADLPDKGTYYRIQAGPFADAAAAERICGALKRRNLGCSIVR